MISNNAYAQADRGSFMIYPTAKETHILVLVNLYKSDVK